MTGAAFLDLRVDTGWRVHPAWQLCEVEGRLVARGGADALWIADGLSPDAVGELLAMWQSGTIDRSRCGPGTAPVVDALAALGALVTGPQPTRRVAVVTAGAPIGLALGDVELVAAADADCVVVLRTTATLEDAAAEFAGLAVPHLLCDLAFHHTVVLGPYVVPHQTACIACLARRVAYRWADEQPPPAPAITADPVLVGALVTRQLARIADGTSTLVNATVAFDADALTATRARLLRWPHCATCGTAPTDGRVHLRWKDPS